MVAVADEDQPEPPEVDAVAETWPEVKVDDEEDVNGMERSKSLRP